MIVPFNLTIILLSIPLSIPLLPFFGLPLYLPTFPRPKRGWPTTLIDENSNSESSSYSSLIPAIQDSLRKSIYLRHSSPGDFFLIRFEKLLLFLQVLSVGNQFTQVSFKGLELQGTSCHNIESSRVDELLDEDLKGGNFLRSSEILTTLTPIGKLHVTGGISETRTSLTGIMDSPINLKLIPSVFLKVLIWDILSNRGGLNSIPKKWLAQTLNSSLSIKLSKKFPGKWYEFLKTSSKTSKIISELRIPKIIRETPPSLVNGIEKLDIGFSNLKEEESMEDLDVILGSKKGEFLSEEEFIQFVLVCYTLVMGFGPISTDSNVTPLQVFEVFNGRLPESFEKKLAMKLPHFMSLLFNSWRLAVKVVYDSAVLGEVEGFDELEVS